MKIRKTSQNAGMGVKRVMALSLVLGLGITTVASAVPMGAKVTETIPEPLAEITMESGFIGEKESNGLRVVKSEEVLVFKELWNCKKYLYGYHDIL